MSEAGRDYVMYLLFLTLVLVVVEPIISFIKGEGGVLAPLFLFLTSIIIILDLGIDLGKEFFNFREHGEKR